MQEKKGSMRLVGSPAIHASGGSVRAGLGSAGVHQPPLLQGCWLASQGSAAVDTTLRSTESDPRVKLHTNEWPQVCGQC